MALGVLCFLGLQACGGDVSMQEEMNDDWFNHPDVLRVVFHPRPEWPAVDHGDFEALDIPVADEVVVGARFYAAGPDKPTILFFHGNGEIVADYDDLARYYVRMGINFFPVDYRGYGRSTGRPTILNMLEDANTVFEFAGAHLSKQKVTGPLIVMGRSLGSASALEIAARHPDAVAGLILDSAFADAVALIERLGARIPEPRPADPWLRQTEKIASFPGPTLILHGTEDRIIPVEEAEALFEASGSDEKRLITIPGAGHNNLLSVGFNRYREAMVELISFLSS